MMKNNIKSLKNSFNSENYDEAIEIAKKCLKESLPSQTKDRAIVHFYLAQSYERTHDFTQAQLYYDKALMYYQGIDDEEILFSINNALGIISNRFDKFKDSETFFEKALFIAERLNDQEKVFSIMNNIAASRRSLGNIYSALELYHQCITYAQKIKKPYFIAMSLYNFTRCKLILNEDISNNMIQDIDKAISLFEKENYIDDSNSAKNVKAGILLSLGKIDKSLDIVQEVKDYYKSNNDTFRYLSSNLDHAKILSEIGENENAIQLVIETIEMAKQNDYPGIRKEGIYALSNYYNKIENFKKEAHYLKKLMKLEAELSKQVYQKNIDRRTIEIEKLMVELETERKEQEIIQLEQELELKKRELISKVVNIIKRNDMLEDILSNLNLMDVNNKKSASILYKTKQTINFELKNYDLWEEFDTWFTDVHSGFFVSLEKHCKNLTQPYRQLAAYLRIGLRSKEIATLMNITVQSVGQYRIRLRKQLKLTRKINLVEFLNSL